MPGRLADERGQGTVEYAGVVLLVALLFAALVAAGATFPGADLARTVAGKLICAVRGDDGCSVRPSELERAYGDELAALISAQTPELRFEDVEGHSPEHDYVSLPVDFRDCRTRACADSILHGSLERTQTGLRPTVFVHVVDCRSPERAAPGIDCSGGEDNLYLQYWLYYPDSATRIFGSKGYHRDDWEQFSIRIGPGGIQARASSHHGYNGSELSLLGNADSDMNGGEPGWDAPLGLLNVAAGSHAGVTGEHHGHGSRRVDAADLLLIPLDGMRGLGKFGFEVTPPWLKEVWANPEATGT